MDRAIEVFISYAAQDAALRDQLEAHLAPLKSTGRIRAWHAGMIGGGEESRRVIEERLRTARVVVLLVSSDYLAGKTWEQEMEPALARARAGNAVVMPVLARAHDWALAPFAGLALLPSNGKAVASWPDRDDAWAHVAKGIRAAVEKLAGEPAAAATRRIEPPVCRLEDARVQRLAADFEPAATEQMGEDEHGTFMSFRVGGVVQRMRWVPAGTFLMGSPESEAGRWLDEGPQHEVTISEGYWLGETPVTQALWEAVMGENPSCFKGQDRPVEQVSWEDCQRFLERLDDRVPGLGARLPTEAEWERACRGGTTGATWVGELDLREDGTAPVLDPIAWYAGNTGDETSPVARKQPNPFGLHDMLGNVWEWCADDWDRYAATAVVDPSGPTMGLGAIIRGGAWGSHADRVRAARRDASGPSSRDNGLGFRLARSQGGPAGAAAPHPQPGRPGAPPSPPAPPRADPPPRDRR